MSRRTVETTAYVAFVKRIVNAASRRVGEEDEIELGLLIGLLGFLEAAIARAVARQRDRGISWDRIGLATGVTRQAAAKRWGKK